MFDKFTNRAKQVIKLAKKEAQRLNHNYLGTEHVLLGLLKLGQGVAVNVLRNLNIDFETVRSEVESLLDMGRKSRSMETQRSQAKPKKYSNMPMKRPPISITTTSGQNIYFLACFAKVTGLQRKSLKT